MRQGLLLAVLLAVVTGPPPAAHAERGADPPALQARLAALTARATALAVRVDETAAQEGALRARRDRLATDRRAAQSRLDLRAREAYMRGRDPLAGWRAGLAVPDLKALAGQELVQRATRAALRDDRALVTAVHERSGELAVLQSRTAALHDHLTRQVREVLDEQDRARAVLAAAERLAHPSPALLRVRAALDDVSARVTRALAAPAGPTSRRADVSQAAVLALLERTGGTVPAGYAASGEVLAGTASWYGPGFVGRPTASGAAYDPERATCAARTLPLGTVLLVAANGRTVLCLVNDRGPYVGDRVLDLSRAGSRTLGYDGVAQVTAQVLRPR